MEFRPLRQARHLARVELTFAERRIPGNIQPYLIGASALAAFGLDAFWLTNWAEAPRDWLTETIGRSSIVRTIEASGSVERAETFLITPRVSGVIQSILRDVDMQARKGALHQNRGAFVKYEKAAECLKKDREALLAFYDFPAEHWKHLRTTNPIESTFATVRHRTTRSKGCLSNKTALAMVFKLVEGAQRVDAVLKATTSCQKSSTV